MVGNPPQKCFTCSIISTCFAQTDYGRCTVFFEPGVQQHTLIILYFSTLYTFKQMSYGRFQGTLHFPTWCSVCINRSAGFFFTSHRVSKWKIYLDLFCSCAFLLKHFCISNIFCIFLHLDSKSVYNVTTLIPTALKRLFTTSLAHCFHITNKSLKQRWICITTNSSDVEGCSPHQNQCGHTTVKRPRLWNATLNLDITLRHQTCRAVWDL